MHKQKLLLHIFPCILFVVLLCGVVHIIGDKPPTSDAREYVTMGYNFLKHNTFSLENKVDPTPTAYREPGMPTYDALTIAAIAQLRDMDLDTLLAKGPGPRILKYAQLPIIALTAVLTMYIVFMLTRNIFYGYTALFLTGFSTSLLYAANNLCAEHLAALLILCVSLFLYKAVKEKSIKYFVLLGAALGLLVLTRGVFQYFIVIILAFLVFLAIVGAFEKRKLLICTIIFSVAYFALAGSWMVRNYIHFGRLFITERGCKVLLLRAETNIMNTKEYLGAFLYWAPDKYLSESLLKHFLGQDAIKPGGALERLNRQNDSSFYLRTKAIWTKLEKELGGQAGNTIVDKKLKSMAKTKILKHPFRHILVTLPIGWRGLFAEHGYRLKIPGSGIVINSSVPTNIVYFAALFFLAFLSVKKRWWDLFAFILPALYLYGIQTFLTHNLARYNKPLIPTLVVALLFVVHYLINKRAIPEKS